VNLTIRCHHELSDEAKMLIERMAQAKLDGDVDERSACEENLLQMGWTVPLMSTYYETSTVEVYISKY
jgi:hypothetical protein